MDLIIAKNFCTTIKQMQITHLYLRFVLNKETIQKRRRERGTVETKRKRERQTRR
jgi:hypothetical protein